MTSAIIISDSQSQLWKTHNGWLWHEWLQYMSALTLQQLVWIYCLKHAGGNKKADSLFQGTVKINRADLLQAVRDSLMQTWNSHQRNIPITAVEGGVLN